MSFQNCPHCGGSGSVGFQGCLCPVCLGARIIDEETGKPPMSDTKDNLQSQVSAMKKCAKSLEEFVEHGKDCLLAQQHAGRKTDDGGYEMLYGYGKDEKWYKTPPPCSCGLSEALSAKDLELEACRDALKEAMKVIDVKDKEKIGFENGIKHLAEALESQRRKFEEKTQELETEFKTLKQSILKGA